MAPRKIDLRAAGRSLAKPWTPVVAGRADDASGLMFEPKTTVNTGTVTSDRTIAHLERL